MFLIFLYIHIRTLNTINCIINYNTVLYSCYLYIKSLSNMYMHLLILKFIFSNIKCYMVLYSYFPYVMLLQNLYIYVQNLKYILVYFIHLKTFKYIYVYFGINVYVFMHIYIWKLLSQNPCYLP